MKNIFLSVCSGSTITNVTNKCPKNKQVTICKFGAYTQLEPRFDYVLCCKDKVYFEANYIINGFNVP